MKIKVTDKTFAEVQAIAAARKPAPKPGKQSGLLRRVLGVAAGLDLKSVNFSHTEVGMEALAPGEPALILMNHSSFVDLEIVAKLFAGRPYHIVCTHDGLVGKDALLRKVGCVPTEKFVSDPHLVRDMKHCVSELRESIVMYPEASYSFDGTATPLPASVGKCAKMLGVPVIMVRTKGAFLRDPLYNNLQKRAVDVSAEVRYLLSPAQLSEMSVEEINAVLAEAFTFDHWREQVADGVRVAEPFRADGLHRVLYKCAACGAEGHMHGEGTRIACGECGAEWELSEEGPLVQRAAGRAAAAQGAAAAQCAAGRELPFVSDWYAWERECVRAELLAGEYRMEEPVDIMMLVDTESIYRVGEGVLLHTADGFVLDGCDGALHYEQSPRASYSLYADYFWYELGDMVCIGTAKCRYYCFPKDQAGAIVAKARLAAEELYKLRG